MLPRVPLLKALEFRSLSLGVLGSASVLELFELLFRKCRIFLQNPSSLINFLVIWSV